MTDDDNTVVRFILEGAGCIRQGSTKGAPWSDFDDVHMRSRVPATTNQPFWKFRTKRPIWIWPEKFRGGVSENGLLGVSRVKAHTEATGGSEIKKRTNSNKPKTTDTRMQTLILRKTGVHACFICTGNANNGLNLHRYTENVLDGLLNLAIHRHAATRDRMGQ